MAAPGRLFLSGSDRKPAVPRNARNTVADSRPSTGKIDPKRPVAAPQSRRSTFELSRPWRHGPQADQWMISMAAGRPGSLAGAGRLERRVRPHRDRRLERLMPRVKVFVLAAPVGASEPSCFRSGQTPKRVLRRHHQTARPSGAARPDLRQRASWPRIGLVALPEM